MCSNNIININDKANCNINYISCDICKNANNKSNVTNIWALYISPGSTSNADSTISHRFSRYISCIRGFFLLASSLSGFGLLHAATNIQDNIYNLRNITNNTNDTFYINGKMTTWSTFGANFAQNYANGTLIIGNNSKSPNINSELIFGADGLIGFINASLSAKEVYLTGNIITGNSFRTGGGANLSFKATNDLNVNQSNIQVRRPGVQGPTTTLSGQNITIANSSLTIEEVDSGGMQIGTDSNTKKVDISNTPFLIKGGTLNIGHNNAAVTINNSTINISGNGTLAVFTNTNSNNIKFGNITANGGTIDLSQANYDQIQTGTINGTGLTFKSKELYMKGDIKNGIFTTTQAQSRSFRAVFGNGNGQDFSADIIKLSDTTNFINANNVNIKSLEFLGPGTVFENGQRNLTINGNVKSVTIGTITNPWYFFGKGFTSRLTTSAKTTIDEIAHRNYTGGSQIYIDSNNEDLEVKKMSFATNGVFGSQGLIDLKGKDIKIGSASSGSLNTIKATASGKIDATSVFFGSDVIGSIGHIDLIANNDINITNLSGRAANYMTATSNNGNINVDNLTFVEDICITDGCGGTITLKASNGNVVVKNAIGGNDSEQGIRAGNFLIAEGKNFYGGAIKAYALPTVGSNSTLDLSKITGEIFIDDFNIRTGTFKASNFHLNNFTVSKSNSYSVVDVNIGKSFINSLQMDLGTSNFADGSDIRFTGGGNILNFNLIEARATSFTRMQNIDNVNVNTLNIMQADFYMKNGIFNSITVQNGQTGFGVFNVTNDAKITGDSMNVNSLLHLKNGSVHAGRLEIALNANNNQTVNQDFSKYLKVSVTSDNLRLMDKSQLQTAIQEAEKTQSTNQNDYKNASGTYITTSDNKHYLLLPDIKSHEKIINKEDQIKNGGTLLIEQTTLKQGTLGNYGTIMLDSGAHYTGTSTALLTLKGNLDNYNKIDIGANANINMEGNFVNKGELIFRFQANTKDSNANDVKFGSLNINGNATFDVSMGTSGALRADILDMKSLQNIKLANNNGVSAESDINTYKLITLTNGTINYSFTQGEYTTTFNKSNNNYTISTNRNVAACVNKDCQTTANNQTIQETYYTTHNANNPWDMDKALVNKEDGTRLWNGIGEYDNEGNYINKLSQSDKKKDCNNDYCGFANANASEAEKGYSYAQERMKNSFSVSYNGNSIDSKYLQVERVVTENMVGFRILRRNIDNFTDNNTEASLCTRGSSSFDCVLYMEAGGNNSWINAIKNETANSYEILRNLFYNDNSAVIFLINVDQTLASSRNLNYFLEVARTLDSTFKHVSDLSSKSSSVNVLSMAMESSRINRLTKISAIHGVGSPIKDQEMLAFEEYQKNLNQALKIAQKIKEQKNLSMNGGDSANSHSLSSVSTNYNQEEQSSVNHKLNDGKLSSYTSSVFENDSGISIMNARSPMQNFIIAAKYDGDISDALLSESEPKVRTNREHSMNLEQTNPMVSIWFEDLSDLIAKFNKREEYPNNIWINALGSLNFSSSGNSQLYGFNAGYDYYIRFINTAIGGYGGYGYGIFKGGYNNFVSNNSNNIFAGLYSRTFIGNNEIDITVNSSYGKVNEELNSGVPNMPLLNLFGQRYGYDVLHIEGVVSYGYAFNLSKGYILKPFLGFSYYALQSSNINHDGSTLGNFLVNTHNNVRHGIGTVVGIEGRKYWVNQSYIFISGQFKQDLALLKNNLDESGHVTTESGVISGGSDLGAVGSQNMLYTRYAKANLQSSIFVAGGGEVGLGRFYLNGSLNFQNAISDKSFGFGFNLGARVIF